MKTDKTDKHTPGPWQYDPDGHFVCVDMDASKMICDIRGWGWLQKMGHQKAVETQIANAKLIASAPELLEALQLLYAELPDLNDDSTLSSAIRKAQLAIKKATL